MPNRKSTIPVFMLHSVNVHDRIWPYSYLSTPVAMLAQLLKYIRKNHYQTLFLDDWYERNGTTESRKEILLTFDDGYLDNWIYLYPLLERYECMATIFINPEFVQPDGDCRPNLTNVWRKDIPANHLADLGFLNWNEIATMDKSPWVDIQSHTMSHTWYFTGSKVIDFYLPKLRGLPEDNQYPWMAWNEIPDRKPYYLNEDQTYLVSFGKPIYQNGRSLGVRRYLPNPEIDRKVCSFVAENRTSFLYNPDARKILKQVFQDFNTKASKKEGCFESRDDQVKRYEYELRYSKYQIEQRLNKTVPYMCWPGGAYNELSLAVSREAGYMASTVASRDRDTSFRNEGAYKRIKRIPMVAELGFKGRQLGTSLNRMKLVHTLTNNRFIDYQLKFEKLFRYLLIHKPRETVKKAEVKP